MPRADGELELLEQGLATPEEAALSLREMDRINRLLGGRSSLARLLWPRIEKIPVSETIRILDAGSGGGYLLAWLAEEIRRRGRRCRLYGVDSDVRCLRESRGRVPSAAFTAGDLVHPPFRPGAFHLVVSTLVLHHLEPDVLGDALAATAQLATEAALLNDLVRDRIPLAFYRLASPFMGLSPLTRYDGQLSVKRAYTADDLKYRLKQESIQAEVHEHWPAYRLTVVTSGRAETDTRPTSQRPSPGPKRP